MKARHYTRTVVGTLLTLAVGVAVFNVAIDARGLFGEWVPAETFGILRDHESRASRSELLARGDWEIVVLGTSRVHVGIDPHSDVFGGRRVLNLGLANTSLCELSNVARQVAERSGASLVYWFVELEHFGESCRIADGVGASRFDPDLDRVEYLLANALGYRATLETIEVLRGADNVFTDDTGLMHERRPVTDPQHAAVAVLKGHHFAMGEFTLSGEKFDLFEAIGRSLLEADIDLRVVLSPVHGSLLEIQHLRGHDADTERWLRELTHRVDALAHDHPARRVELWDFSGHRGEAISPLPEIGEPWLHYRDPSHFRPAFGTRLIEAMGDGGRDPDNPDQVLGFQLRADDIERHIERRRSERAGYVANHPAEIERVRAIVESETASD